MASSGRRRGAQNTGILQPGHKAVVESDAYGGPKCSSKICSNDDEATTVASKIIVDDVLLYGRVAGHILAYFRTVLDILKYHCAILKLKKFKWFQYRCNFLGIYVAAGGT